MGLAALGFLGQPAAWAADTTAFEAKAAKYREEREKAQLTKPMAEPCVENTASMAGQLVRPNRLVGQGWTKLEEPEA